MKACFCLFVEVEVGVHENVCRLGGLRVCERRKGGEERKKGGEERKEGEEEFGCCCCFVLFCILESSILL